MIKKSFVFIMLLAASLIGISSAAYHRPEIAVGQPQQQQQQQPPSTAPNIIGKRLTSPQQQQQSNIETLVQIQQDKALVDRLFPYIIQKIDGATLLQKIDAKTLAGKLLPHMQVKVSGALSTSELIKVSKGALDSDTYHHVYA